MALLLTKEQPDALSLFDYGGCKEQSMEVCQGSSLLLLLLSAPGGIIFGAD